MFTINELANKIAEYRDGHMRFRAFQDWFEENSAGAYDVANLKDAYSGVEAALAEFYYDNIGEDRLKEVLANAIRPFAHKRPAIFPVSWRDPQAKRVERESELMSGEHLTFGDIPRGPILQPRSRPVALSA